MEQGRLWAEAVTWKAQPCGGAGGAEQEWGPLCPPPLQSPAWAGPIWSEMAYLEIQRGSLSRSGHGESWDWLSDSRVALGQDVARNEQRTPGGLSEVRYDSPMNAV